MRKGRMGLILVSFLCAWGTVTTSTASTSGLVAYWKFDEGSGAIVYDSSGNDNQGTIHGATWTTGKFGNALSFDGKNDWVKVDSSKLLDTRAEITLEAWVNPKEEGAVHPILEYNDGAHAGVHVWQYSAWSNLFVNFAHTSGWGIIEARGVMTTGWQHITAVYDGTDGKLYRNGELVATKKIGALLLRTSFDLYIGRRPTDPRHFNGLIDEVRIYNRALSKEEIRADMEMAAPRVSSTATPYNDVFWLSTGELIFGELVAFGGTTFTIATEQGVIDKEKTDVATILIGARPLISTELSIPSKPLSQWAVRAMGSSEYDTTRWSAQQATGEPDTFRCGDIDTS